jgi:hypothetical protein
VLAGTCKIARRCQPRSCTHSAPKHIADTGRLGIWSEKWQGRISLTAVSAARVETPQDSHVTTTDQAHHPSQLPPQKRRQLGAVDSVMNAAQA